MALIQENNRQYYEGAQSFQTIFDQFEFTTTFDTNLKFLSDNPSNQNYNQNNFKIYKSSNGLPSSYSELNSTNDQFRVSGNTISWDKKMMNKKQSKTTVQMQAFKNVGHA